MHDDIVDSSYYRSMFKKLIQPNHIWLDLSYSIDIISKFIQWLCVCHLIATKCIIHEISRTSHYQIFYTNIYDYSIISFIDTNQAGDLGEEMLIVDFMFKLGRNFIT